MSKRIVSILGVAALFGALAAPARAADEYTFDGSHTGIVFRLQHLGLSWTFGRFSDFSGGFTIAADPAQTAFVITIKTESIDTGNAKRDEHLRSPDFFNAKQFPVINFKSTAVKPVEGGFEVTGDFTLHGVTKPLTMVLKGGQKAEFPKGVQRTGYSSELILKRSEFGIDKYAPAPVGEDVYITISFEGVKK